MVKISFNRMYLSKVQKLRALNKLNTIIMLNGLTLIFTLCVSYLLIPSLGITGAGISWLMSQLIIFIYSFSQNGYKGYFPKNI